MIVDSNPRHATDRPHGILESVNVGRPQLVAWRGQQVRTAIWKRPVPTPARVRRLNVDGDAQADLIGHGGEHRAVFVYQRESYAYWEDKLGRVLSEVGCFGENFTVSGLSDEDVCVGDRFAIGSALFEVSQPRVTCYKVGIRLDEPRMPALLTGHGRPGFYLRVLREGDVAAGDAIRLVGRDPAGLSVRRVSDLLYTADRPDEQLRRALSITALPDGWRDSLTALLHRDGVEAGNVGLTAPVAPPAWPGFRPFRIEQAVLESRDVRSIWLRPVSGERLDAHRPGQAVSVRLPASDGSPLVRSYSLSAPADGERLRISVKRIGPASSLVHALGVGATIELAAPRGDFVLERDAAPVILISAGVGLTPVLAMLAELASARDGRRISWIHVARDADSHPHAAQAGQLLERLPLAASHVRYTRPGPESRLGRDFDAVGRLTLEALRSLDLDPSANAYVCGPAGFMAQVASDLAALGLAPDRIRCEAFGATASGRPPHAPPRQPQTGPAVSFARAGLTVRWGPEHGSLLELAEACDVPVSWSCRSGVCHRCQAGLLDGAAVYDPAPVEAPPPGQVLLCCARPVEDCTLDL